VQGVLPEVAACGAPKFPACPALAGFGRVLQISPVKWLPGQTGPKTVKHVKTQKNTDLIFMGNGPHFGNNSILI
jgi:hypothetical protein